MSERFMEGNRQEEAVDLKDIVNDIKESENYVGLEGDLQSRVNGKLDIFQEEELNPRAMEEAVLALSGDLTNLVDEAQREDIKKNNSLGVFLEITSDQKVSMKKAIEKRREEIENNYKALIDGMKDVKKELEEQLKKFVVVDSSHQSHFEMQSLLDAKKEHILSLVDRTVVDVENGQIKKVIREWDDTMNDEINSITQGTVLETIVEQLKKSNEENVFGTKTEINEEEISRILNFVESSLREAKATGKKLLAQFDDDVTFEPPVRS